MWVSSAGMSLNEGVVPTPTIKGSFESKSPLWCHRQWDKIQTGQRTGCRELLFPGDTYPGPSHNSSSPHLDSTDALISVAPSQLTSAPPNGCSFHPLCPSFSPTLPGVSQEAGGSDCHFLSWMCVFNCDPEDSAPFTVTGVFPDRT